MVDAGDLKSPAARRESSSLSSGTKQPFDACLPLSLRGLLPRGINGGRMQYFRAIFSGLFLFFTSLGGVRAETATVAVAANFLTTAEIAGEAFTRDTGHEIQSGFGLDRQALCPDRQWCAIRCLSGRRCRAARRAGEATVLWLAACHTPSVNWCCWCAGGAKPRWRRSATTVCASPSPTRIWHPTDWQRGRCLASCAARPIGMAIWFMAKISARR